MQPPEAVGLVRVLGVCQALAVCLFRKIGSACRYLISLIYFARLWSQCRVHGKWMLYCSFVSLYSFLWFWCACRHAFKNYRRLLRSSGQASYMIQSSCRLRPPKCLVYLLRANAPYASPARTRACSRQPLLVQISSLDTASSRCFQGESIIKIIR